jgi:hypothetical protein
VHEEAEDSEHAFLDRFNASIAGSNLDRGNGCLSVVFSRALRRRRLSVYGVTNDLTFQN